jgi:hypothetical protein
MKEVGQVLKCSTIRDLLRTLYKVLSQKQSGWSDVNIMFFDSERSELYAVTLGDEKENLQKMRDALKRAKTERERAAVYLEDYMRDFLILENQMLLYPSNIGITDTVFKR